MSPRKRQHGGPRSGNPGGRYPNRSDLQTGPRTPPVQAPTAASGQTYGVKKQQLDAQAAIPLPATAPVVPLSVPSQRPNEPVTTGLPIGPGAGPEALVPTPGPADDIRASLAAWYEADPSPELADMLAQLDARGR